MNEDEYVDNDNDEDDKDMDEDGDDENDELLLSLLCHEKDDFWWNWFSFLNSLLGDEGASAEDVFISFKGLAFRFDILRFCLGVKNDLSKFDFLLSRFEICIFSSLLLLLLVLEDESDEEDKEDVNDVDNVDEDDFDDNLEEEDDDNDDDNDNGSVDEDNNDEDEDDVKISRFFVVGPTFFCCWLNFAIVLLLSFDTFQSFTYCAMGGDGGCCWFM